MKHSDAAYFDRKTIFAVIQCCFISFLLLTLVTSRSYSQYKCDNPTKSEPGCFVLNTLRDCAPVTIMVTDCNLPTDSVKNVKYLYQGSDGVFVDFNGTQQLFDKPGKYTIRQLGSKKSTCMFADQQIEVLDRPKVAFTSRICANRVVELSITNPVYDEYAIDWGDGQQSTIPKSTGSIKHTYPSAALYTVKVAGKYVAVPSGCTSDLATATITTINALTKPIVNRLEVKDVTSVELQFNAIPDFTYKVYRTGVSQEIATFEKVTGLQTLPISGLDTQTNLSFQVIASDACGNQAPSDRAYTVTLKTEAESDRNKVQWTYGGGAAQYALEKNKAPAFSVLTNPYYDAEVQCSQSYCYRIVATVGSFQSISNESCVTAKSTTIPPAVEKLLVSIEGGYPLLSWQVPENRPAKEYTIYRAENGGNFVRLTQVATNQLIDKQAYVGRSQYCYQVRYDDFCGNTSAFSERACPILLTKVENSQAYQLRWTAYEQLIGDASYSVELLDASGNVVSSTGRGVALDYLESEKNTTQQALFFRVKAVGAGDTEAISYSNIVEIRQEMRVFLPDAFTPNGNTLNEKFGAKGLFIKNFFMQIYNRWGELVFATKDIAEEWDGTKDGQPVPVGTYVYKVEVEDFFGRIIRKSKNFILIR